MQAQRQASRCRRAWRWVQRHCVLLPRSTYLTHVCARRSRQNSMHSVMLAYCCRSPVQYFMMLKQLQDGNTRGQSLVHQMAGLSCKLSQRWLVVVIPGSTIEKTSPQR